VVPWNCEGLCPLTLAEKKLENYTIFMLGYILKRVSVTFLSIFFVLYVVYVIVFSCTLNSAHTSYRIPGIQLESAKTFSFYAATRGYINWLKEVSSFSFGMSSYYGERVSRIIITRLKNTMYLNLLAMFILLVLGLLLGVFSAMFKSRFITLIEGVFFVLYAVPDFVLAILLIIVFSLTLGWFPSSGFISVNHEQLSPLGKVFDCVWHLFLPALSLSLSLIIFLSRFTKNSIVGILSNQHIIALTVRGVDTFGVKFKHIFKNAVSPFLSLMTFLIPGLIGGSIIIETIFGFPGIGRIFYKAAVNRDFPLVLAVSFVDVVLIFFSIFLTDVLYRYYKKGVEDEKNF